MFVIVLTAIVMRPPVFPADFLGDWRGTMVWAKPGSDKPQSVAMRLKIESTEKADTYNYLLQYGEGPKDVRPYKLVAVDSKVGHWKIDEGGGVELDEFWIDGSLVGVFSVGKNTIHSRLRREGKTLVSELTTYESEPLSSGGQVTTRRVISTQRAVLRRS